MQFDVAVFFAYGDILSEFFLVFKIFLSSSIGTMGLTFLFHHKNVSNVFLPLNNKTGLRVSNQVGHKLGCTATEDV